MQLQLPTALVKIGENFYGARDLFTQRKACIRRMPDFMRIGGVTGWMRAQGDRALRRVFLCRHISTLRLPRQVMRVTETAHWLEGRTS